MIRRRNDIDIVAKYNRSSEYLHIPRLHEGKSLPEIFELRTQIFVYVPFLEGKIEMLDKIGAMVPVSPVSTPYSVQGNCGIMVLIFPGDTSRRIDPFFQSRGSSASIPQYEWLNSLLAGVMSVTAS